MLKNILITTCITASLCAVTLETKYEKEWNSLKPEQMNLAKFIFNFAAKDDLAYTATAIAWQESQFGRWQVNMNSNKSWDCGVFQNNTKTVANHHDIPYNLYTKKEICTDLITSFSYSYLNFAREVRFWDRVHKGNWKKVWASYNGGYKGNKHYSKSITARINVIKKHLKELAK